MKWIAWHDGWFEYWRCSKCGHKQQLLINEKPLPEFCPECHKRMIWDNHIKKQVADLKKNKSDNK